MKEVKVKGIDGKEIVRLIPENEEDLKKLRELEKKKKIDPRSGFRD